MDVIRWGSFTIYPYGLCVAGGALLGLLIMLTAELRGRLKRGTVSWFAVLGIPLALFFSRAGFVLFSLDRFGETGLGGMLRMTDGGHMFFGALAGLGLAGWITARITHQNAGKVLDSTAVPAGVLIAAARMGEPLIKGAYLGIGYDIEEWFLPDYELVFFSWEDPSLLYRFPFAVQGPYYSAGSYEQWCFSIFFLEACAAVIIALILLLWRTKRPGTKAMMFPVMYAGCQAVLESMRCDAVLRLGFVKFDTLSLGFVKGNQLLTLPILLAAVTIALVRMPREKLRWWVPVYGYGSILLHCGVIMAMEFTRDMKIEMLQWMRIDLIFIVMALAAFHMIVSTCIVIQRSDEGPPGSLLREGIAGQTETR